MVSSVTSNTPAVTERMFPHRNYAPRNDPQSSSKRRRRINKLAKLPQKKVLTYQKGRGSPATVKRHYTAWRSQQNPPIPKRCDNPGCVYHQSPLVWNDKQLEPVLDHKNGVSGDNRPANFQFLCPNCNSQRPTHGGGNKGKVKQSAGGFGKMRKGGGWDYELPHEPGEYTLKLGQAQTTRTARKRPEVV